jgi:hypothetical protein
VPAPKHVRVSNEQVDDLSAAGKVSKVNLLPSMRLVCLHIRERTLAMLDDPLSHHRVVKILVIEKLATSDRVTLTIERLPEGKMHVTSNGWDGEKMFLPDQVLGVRWLDGSLHVVRKERHHDKWDPPIEP